MAKNPSSVADAAAERRSGTVSANGKGGDPDLDLLLTWPDEHRSRRWRISLGVSLAVHLVLFFSVPEIKLLPHRTRPRTGTRQVVTHLYLPQDLLTQRAPNRGKITKTFDLADLLAAKEAQRQAMASARGKVRRLELPKKASNEPAKPAAPQISAEVPAQVATNQQPPAGVPDSVVAPLPPTPEPAANPTPAQGTEEPAKPLPRIVVPKNSVQDVIHQMAKHDAGSSSMIITDNGGPQNSPSGGLTPTQGRMGSAIELKTDPQGADFKPYLTQVLAIVRRNWFSVLPDSARMKVLRGSTTLQFVVNRDGSIPKLVISDSSGIQPLDRAAVAGLSMSNPLPPLPAEFKGGLIRLQFSFNYNVPTN